MNVCLEKQGPLPRSGVDGERGSILIAAVVFLFFVFLVAGMAVDVGRYYLYSENTQNIADGAALAGARALSQYSMDDINEDKVNESVVRFIRSNQGSEHAKLYAKNAAREVKVSDNITEFSDAGNPTANIHIVRFDPDDQQLCQTFSTNPDGLSPSQNSPTTSRPLGSALRWGGDGARVPVTLQIEIQNNDGPNETYEPWGSYDDPSEGDLNTDGSKPDFELNVAQEDTMVLRARSWDDRYGAPSVIYQTGTDQPDGHTPETRVLRDGDHPFESEGFKGQDDAQDFIQDYINDEGEIDIGRDQALVFFELGSDDPSSDAYDMQDLVMLLSFPPPSSGSGGVRGGNLPPYITSSGDPCGSEQPVYRVGVQTVENFSPLLLPRSVFGQQNKAIQRHAVAEVRPRILRSYRNRSMNCAAFAGGGINFQNTSGLSTAGGSLCSGGNVNGNGAAAASIGTVSLPKGASFSRPSGSVSQIKRHGGRPIPSLRSTLRNNSNPDYNVDMTQYNTGDWPDADHRGSEDMECDADVTVTPSGTAAEDKAMVTEGDAAVVWQSDSTPVCVTRQDASDPLEIEGQGRMVIQGDESQPLGIYSTQRLRISGGLTLDGGLFSTRDIVVDGLGGHRFRGQRDTLGGVALWAGQNLEVRDENNGFRGIVGADRNVSIGQAGMAGSDVMGVILAGGTLTLAGDDAILNPAGKRYRTAVLTSSGWSQREMSNLGNRIPPMAEATVRLID